MIKIACLKYITAEHYHTGQKWKRLDGKQLSGSKNRESVQYKTKQPNLVLQTGHQITYVPTHQA
jgi:hypothetical protein